MKIGIYARQSRQDASGSTQETSPAIQIAEVKRWAKAQGHTVAAEYVDDGFSGGLSPEDRPGLCQLCADAEAKRFDAMVCVHQDRLSRDLYDLLGLARFFKRHKVEMIFLSQPYDDSPESKLQFAMMGAINDYYRHDIGRKIVKKCRGLAYEGKFPAGQVPFGYRWDSAAKEILPSDRAADAVTLFRTFVECGGRRGETARRMNELGITTTQGGKWYPATVSCVIPMLFYGGIIRYQEIREPSERIPRIVPPELVEQAQALYQATINARPTGLNVYTSILKCGACGGPMIVGYCVKDYRKYVCAHRCGGMSVVSERKVDKLVLKALGKVIRAEQKGIDAANNEQEPPDTNEAQRKASLKQAQAKRERTLRLYTTGVIGEPELKRLLTECDRDIGRLSRRVKIEPPLRLPTESLMLAVDMWADWGVDEKRAFLLAVSPRITVLNVWKQGTVVTLHTVLPGGDYVARMGRVEGRD